MLRCLPRTVQVCDVACLGVEAGLFASSNASSSACDGMRNHAGNYVGNHASDTLGGNVGYNVLKLYSQAWQQVCRHLGSGFWNAAVDFVPSVVRLGQCSTMNISKHAGKHLVTKAGSRLRRAR